MVERLSRLWAALRRYKWLVFAIGVTGASVGYGLVRLGLVRPQYDVYATIWIAREANGEGPVRAPGLLNDAGAWTELARSFAVLDQVVARLALYVEPRDVADTVLLRNIRPSERLVPGAYVLSIDPDGRGYALSRRASGQGDSAAVVERGVVGDSIGRSVGILWQPPPAALRGGRRIEFDVVTPREAALRLNSRLAVRIEPNSNLMRLSLSGNQPVLLASTMNTLIDVFVKEAARLKRENLSAVAATVSEQLDSAKRQLDQASAALESFKVNTITLPSENTPVAAGVSIAANPVFTDFFNQNIAYKTALRDREALEGILRDAEARGGRISIQALKALPVVTQSNTGLQNEIAELEARQAQLRRLLMSYTDSYPPVQRLRSEIDELETKTIPALARLSLEQLRQQEQELKRRIDGASEELRRIPQRTIEEARRQREVEVASKVYMDLRNRAVAARLAEMSALPDVSVLDSAVAPSRPSSDSAPAIFLAAVSASIVVALLLVIVLDRLDPRFRYPEQATRELGLDILGAIPTMTNPRSTAARLQEASQLIESFRSLALTLRSTFEGTGPVQLTVSSPGPGDGKSFISANLASALADSGYRTVLVDGDVRRGALHNVFGPMPQEPGLLDYLAGEASLASVVRPTPHENLFLVPCGRRRRHGPELLSGDTMVRLIRELRGQFDAIIVDSAPLGAGIDPYALGVATGAMLIVLRTGETDRKLAQAKLEVLDRMPVRILGTVLNDIGENPQFRYYYYLEGYGTVESGSEPAARIGPGAVSPGGG
jgi:capsular exopolysaccharide synthesis family protein